MAEFHFAELIAVRKRNGEDYERGNWRVQQVGTRHIVYMLNWGKAGYVADIHHSMWPDGRRTLDVSDFNTGSGEKTVKGDKLVLITRNSVWCWRLFSVEEYQEHDIRWQKWAKRRNVELYEIAEELIQQLEGHR